MCDSVKGACVTCMAAQIEAPWKPPDLTASPVAERRQRHDPLPASWEPPPYLSASERRRWRQHTVYRRKHPDEDPWFHDGKVCLPCYRLDLIVGQRPFRRVAEVKPSPSPPYFRAHTAEKTPSRIAPEFGLLAPVGTPPRKWEGKYGASGYGERLNDGFAILRESY